MSALLTLDSISLAAPDGRMLFEGLTLAVGRERIGLVGRNGSGKSTLLRTISGEIEPASGAIHRQGAIGVLRQIPDEGQSVAEALGVAGAVHSHVNRRVAAVATLRCLGCPANVAFAVYLVQALTLAAAGAVIGAGLGLALHGIILGLFRDSLPVPIDISPPWLAIVRTTLAGLAVCGGFALLPLLRIRQISPGCSRRSHRSN